MKLIFLYGPPAVGKITIANKLSNLTGIPLFHNHTSRDIVEDIYGDDLGRHYNLVHKIRNDVLDHCATNNTDLIFTFVYGGESDDDVVRSHIKSIEVNGGEVKFVELTASRNDLLERVGNESRKRSKKLSDPAVLQNLIESIDFCSIPLVNTLKVNTSEHEPDESAELIAKELNLI